MRDGLACRIDEDTHVRWGRIRAGIDRVDRGGRPPLLEDRHELAGGDERLGEHRSGPQHADAVHGCAPTRVNSISPGTLRTTYWTGTPDQQLEQIFDRVAKGLPVGRVGTAEDIARAVQFVIDSGFMTGTVLCVDGGLPHSSL
jgi:Enoyl-(Acyl carrier protein) reductase